MDEECNIPRLPVILKALFVCKLLNIILFVLLNLCILFAMSDTFISPKTDTKWYAFYLIGGIWLLFWCITETSDKNINIDFYIFTIITCCFLNAVYGVFQCFLILPAAGCHPVVGCFDNPAGFSSAISISFPFCFYFFQKDHWIRIYSTICAITMLTAIILSESRSGILTCFLISVLYLHRLFKLSRRIKLVLLAILVIIVFCGLYLYKKDSADGRMLIWMCSMEMIKEKPLWGFGNNGFRANYMDYQAKYFENNPGSKYVMLAGNVHHPFNEFLRFTVNHGIVGVVLLLTLIFVLLRLSVQKSDLSRMVHFSLIAIGVFSSFSYPFKYPFTWLTLIFCISLLMRNAKIIRKNKILNNTIISVLVVCIPVFLFQKYDQMLIDAKWGTIEKSTNEEIKLTYYADLYPKLKNNFLFLYNYSAALSLNGYYGKSLEIANECNLIFSDYDLELLIGDNYREIRKYDEAEKCYKQASKMFPVKFRPLYDLHSLYLASGKIAKAKELAFIIRDKPIKIVSPEVIRIKSEMKQFLKSTFN